MNISNVVSKVLPAVTPRMQSQAPPQARPAPEAPPPAQETPSQYKQAELDATFSRANQRLASQGRSLAFDWDKDSRRVIVTIRDTQTNEVIRQVPTEQAIEIAKQITRSLEGFSELA